jgi:hypothetical protein
MRRGIVRPRMVNRGCRSCATIYRLLIAVGAIVGSLNLVAPTAAGELIVVRAGPDGQYIVSTPNEDYAIYPLGGGEFWIGTEREFERARVRGVAESLGMRQANIVGDDGDMSFVQSTTLSAYLPHVELSGIFGDVVFDRSQITYNIEPISANDRYVLFSWYESAVVPVHFRLIDLSTKTVFAPLAPGEEINSPDDGSGPVFTADFGIPFVALKHPFAVVIFETTGKPAAVPVRSLAWADYAVEKQTADELTSDGIALTGDQSTQLKRLCIADPAICAKPKPRKKVPAIASTFESAVATVTPPPTDGGEAGFHSSPPAPTPSPIVEAAVDEFDVANAWTTSGQDVSGNRHLYLHARIHLHPRQSVLVSSSDFEVVVPMSDGSSNTYIGIDTPSPQVEKYNFLTRLYELQPAVSQNEDLGMRNSTELPMGATMTVVVTFEVSARSSIPHDNPTITWHYRPVSG